MTHLESSTNELIAVKEQREISVFVNADDGITISSVDDSGYAMVIAFAPIHAQAIKDAIDRAVDTLKE